MQQLDLAALFFSSGYTYASPYSIDNKAPSTFMVLASICDENRHLRVLMEDLLYATVVHTPSKIPMTRLLLLLLRIIRPRNRLIVTQVMLMGQVIRRVLARRMTRRRGRGGLAVKQGCTIISIPSNPQPRKQEEETGQN